MKRFSGFLIAAASCFILYSFVLFRFPPVRLIKYSHAAQLLLKGELKGERILDFSPLYLRINVIFQKFDASADAILWLHIICVSLAAGLLFLLLSRFFRASIVIAGMAAYILDRSLMVYTYTFEPEPLVILFITAFTYLVTLGSNRAAFAAGICFGLGIITRPNFVPVLLAVPFFFKWNSSEWRKKSILLFLPAFIFLGGLWIRNATITGYFSPMVMNPGTAIFEGNNPNSCGLSSIYPAVLNQLAVQYSGRPDYHHQLYRDFARRITGKQLNMLEVNSYWSQKAWAYLLDHPGRTIRLLATKMLHLFHSYQWHDLSVARTIEKMLQHGSLWNTPFAVLSALTLAGLLLATPEWKRYLIFYAIFLSQAVFMLIIYVSARQRVSILFLFVFFACAACDRMIAITKTRWLLVLVVVLSIALHLRTDRMYEEEHLWESIERSNEELSAAYKLRRESKFKEAAEKSALSVAIAPWYLDSRRPANLPFQKGYLKTVLQFSRPQNEAQALDRAVLLLEEGNEQEAESILRVLDQRGYKLKRDDYQSSELQFYLAKAALGAGQQQEAIGRLQQGLKNSPGDPHLLAYLKALTGRSEYESRLNRYFDEIDGAYYLGNAYLAIGRPQRAVSYFQYVLQVLPEFRAAHLYLAAALSESSDHERAAMHYRKAIQLNPDPVFFEKQMIFTFQQLAEKKKTAIDYYSYGVVLRQFGHFSQALEQQKIAIALDPRNQAILGEIRNLQKVLERSRRN